MNNIVTASWELAADRADVALRIADFLEAIEDDAEDPVSVAEAASYNFVRAEVLNWPEFDTAEQKAHFADEKIADELEELGIEVVFYELTENGDIVSFTLENELADEPIIAVSPRLFKRFANSR